MRVLYDITTLAHIHCAPGVQGAGIVRYTEEMGLAIARALGDAFSVSVAASQYERAIRYLTETGVFGLDRLALPSFGAADISGSPLTARGADVAKDDTTIQANVARYVAGAYSPERIYNPGRFDIFHLNWRGTTTLPDKAYPTVIFSPPDVIALKHPEWFIRPGEPNQLGDYLATVLKSVRRHHAVTVYTESVKRDVLDLFPHISTDQVHVVPLGVSDRFALCDNPALIEAVRAHYGIPAGHRYILCVNTLEPRKNMVAVVDAYARLVSERATDDLSLVLTGSHGWLSDDLMAQCAQVAGSARASVIVTGYVDDVDMAPLYSGASLFCYPSFDEGFGLPVLEAMKCGVPVITSDRPPLVEAAGGAALTVDPNDRAGLAAAMDGVLSDRALADDLRVRGSDRAANSTWDRSAAMMILAYERASEARGVYRGGPIAAGNGGIGVVDRDRTRQLIGQIATRSVGDLEGAFRGERVFILGERFDPDSEPVALFENEFTIAINQFHCNYDRIKWKPTFYVVAGGGIDHASALALNAVTGSTFVFEDKTSDLLRTGPDVISFGFDADSSRVTGVDLFRDAPAPDISGPDRSLAAAIQIAYHAGFGPIYLVACEAERSAESIGPHGVVGSTAAAITERAAAIRRALAGRAEMRAWHVACRDACEAAARQIVNISHETLFDVYPRADRHRIFASSDLPEFGRDRHARVDETQVVSTTFGDADGRTRTMIDVGAHRGTSAQHFVGRNWLIHCFEPDPTNRDHLARKYATCTNLTIDVRAVGAEPATHLPFFTSAESSGISGLSAFRESHKLLGYVDVTTVAEIVDQHGISRIDFLKIDVEGFDFSVLKGVPWDRIQPDVIECEYEDAKTIRLGHTLLDLAEYLRARGYVVYVSEWHPIIRYGTAHDWRRVVPYPGFDIPSNSWGNVLAFKHDPGYDAVQAAFARHVTTNADSLVAHPVQTERVPVPTTTVTPSTPANLGREASRPRQASTQQKRRFYADSADRLRVRAPRLYPLVRYVKRALVAGWRRHRIALTVGVALLTGLVVAGFAASDEVLRYSFWTAAAVAVLAGAIVGVGLYAHRLARLQTALSRGMADVQNRLATQSKRSSTRMMSVEAQIQQLSTTPRELSALRQRLQQDAQRLEAVQNTLHNVESDLQVVGTQRHATAELQISIREMSEASAGMRATISELQARLSGLQARQSELQARQSELQAQLGEVEVASQASKPDDQFMYSNYSNAPNVRMHVRLLTNDDVEHIRNEWLRRFGLTMNDRELRYMAHKICLDEERCEGRLATTIQAAMLRALALLSVKSDVVELLEIGTLSGISAGSLYRIGSRAQRTIRLTLIDPLTGYYETSVKDGQTGVPITSDVLVENLDALGVDPSHYRVIQRMSTDPQAFVEASDRQYDFVMIDGDHSLGGVSNDFELFGSLVRRGGLLIFDDYDTADWPAIGQYVDDHVRPTDEWLWIGGEWRTAILQKKMRVAPA